MRRKLTSVLAVGALSVLTVSGCAPTEDSVSGGGVVAPVSGPAQGEPLGVISFDVRSAHDGTNPTGTVTLYSRYGTTSTYAVTCLRVSGNQAAIGTGTLIFYVTDNVASGSPDTAYQSSPGTSSPDGCPEPIDTSDGWVLQGPNGADLRVVDAKSMPVP